jgi:alpha/beta superfamily hydrolase
MPTAILSEKGHYLSAAHGPLAIQTHADPQAVHVTVIIMPPLLEERKSCHAALTEVGRALAAEGAFVLRPDAAATGDSPGACDEFALRRWEADLADCAGLLRRHFPRAPQCWLGVRASAALVLRAASVAPADQRPAAVILWEPVTGADFLHQLHQRRQVNEMLAYGRVRVGRRTAEAQLAAGETVDFDGYPVTADLHRELAQLDLRPWPAAGLVVTTSPDTHTADACLQHAPSLARCALRLPPFWNTVGHVDTRPLTEATTAWVRQHLSPAPSSAVTPRAAPPPLLADNAVADLLPDGSERMLCLPGGQAALRGVLHLSPPHCRRGRIVFLPGWSGDRCGPHRMFVHAARRLAAQGFTCLRFDFAGRGDSDPLPQPATIASMTADARAALAWLQANHPDGGPLTLLAICSGCKVAIGAAAQEPAVARLALWSAESMGSLRHAATGRRKLLAMLRAYAAKLLRRETWRKLARGQLRPRMVGRALVSAEVRSPEEARAEDAALRLFQKFRGDLLLVFGGSDPDAPGSSAAYSAFCERHGIRQTSHLIPHAGHSYYGLAWEAELFRITESWLNAPRA